MKKSIFIVLPVVTLIFSCSPMEPKTPTVYPATKKVDSVDSYFGIKVSDPYRWLENDTTRETDEWVRNENALTFAYLSKIPYRDQIRKRLEKVYNYERLSAPFKEGGYYYFYKNNGLQNHSIL